jgi:hypothetical protein
LGGGDTTQADSTLAEEGRDGCKSGVVFEGGGCCGSSDGTGSGDRGAHRRQWAGGCEGTEAGFELGAEAEAGGASVEISDV